MNREYLRKIKKYSDECVKACLTGDVQKFKEFYWKWYKKGYVDVHLPKNDRVIEVAMRKMICEAPNVQDEEKEKAKKWLIDRGFKTNIW